MRVYCNAVSKSIYMYCALLSDCSDLIGRLLQPCETDRITMNQLLCHPWMEEDMGPPRWQVAVISTPEKVNREAASYVSDKYRVTPAEVAAAVKARQISTVTATYHLLDRKLRRHRGVLHPTGVSGGLVWPRHGNDRTMTTKGSYHEDKSTEPVCECNSRLFPAIGSTASSPRSSTEKPTDLLRPLPMAKQNLKVSHNCSARDYRDCLNQLKLTRTEHTQGKDSPGCEETSSAKAAVNADSQEMRAQGKSVTFSFNTDKLAKANLTPRELHILTDRWG